jgi:hypothetical protein
LAGTALGPCAHRLDAPSIDTGSPRLALRIRRARTALLTTLCNHLLRGSFAVLEVEPGLAKFASAAGEACVNAELLACALLARQTGNASCPGSGARLATSRGRRRRVCALTVLGIQPGLANFANTVGEARLNSFLGTLAVFCTSSRSHNGCSSLRMCRQWACRSCWLTQESPRGRQWPRWGTRIYPSLEGQDTNLLDALLIGSDFSARRFWVESFRRTGQAGTMRGSYIGTLSSCPLWRSRDCVR